MQGKMMKRLHPKKLGGLLAGSALSLMLAGAAQAQTNEIGASRTDTLSVSGTLDRYIDFTVSDNIIDLADMGGPTYGNQSSPGVPNPQVWESSDFSGGTGSQFNTANSGGNGAEFVFDSNSNVSLIITNSGNLVTNEGSATDEDTVPTQIRTRVKGTSVTQGSSTVSSNNSVYTDLGLSAAGAVQDTYFYTQGAFSGVRLDMRVTRNGVDDHHGTYLQPEGAETTLTWADLD